MQPLVFFLNSLSLLGQCIVHSKGLKCVCCGIKAAPENTSPLKIFFQLATI